MFQLQRTDTATRGRKAPAWIDPAQLEQIGGYRFVHALGRGPCGERCLAEAGPDAARVVLHAVRRSMGSQTGGGASTSREGKRFLELIAPIRVLEHAHILPICDAIVDRAGWHWLVSPYVGASEGLMTLDQVRKAKPTGRLSTFEVRTAVRQLFSAMASAHRRGVVNGGFSAKDILVDRHGSLLFELYGLQRRLSGDTPVPGSEDWNAIVRAELRAAVDVVYEALTGAAPMGERLPASRVVKKLDRSWDRWFELGLSESEGFDCPEEALAVFEGQAMVEMKLGHAPLRPTDRHFRWWSSSSD